MKRSLILLLILIVSIIFSNILINTLGSIWLEDPSIDSFSMFVVYTGIFTLSIVIMSLFGHQLGWMIPSARPRIEKLNLPLILLALLLMFSIEILLSPLFEMMPESNLDQIYDMMRGGLWAIMTGVIAAPILEEFLFRGIVQTNLIRMTNPFVGIIVASLVFGAVHLVPQQIISASLTAMVIGTIFYLTGSLMTVIVIHMLNNGLAYIQLMYFGEQADLREILFRTEQAYVIGYAISAIFVVGMLTTGIIRIAKRHKAHLAHQRAAHTAQ